MSGEFLTSKRTASYVKLWRAAALSLIYGNRPTSIFLLDMFPIRRKNQSHPAARWLSARAQLLWLALVVLLSAAVPNSSAKSKSGSTQTPTGSQAAAARPGLLMTATRRDFGDVFAGEEIEAAFEVRNAGTAPLELAQKSSLGMRPGGPGFPVTASWPANEGLLIRRVAALRVAPT